MKIKVVGNQLWLYCPGCKAEHCFGRAWGWNNDIDNPHVESSILVTGYVDSDEHEYGKEVHCHSFIEKGNTMEGSTIRFLSDCNHELAGKTVNLPHYT